MNNQPIDGSYWPQKTVNCKLLNPRGQAVFCPGFRTLRGISDGAQFIASQPSHFNKVMSRELCRRFPSAWRPSQIFPTTVEEAYRHFQHVGVAEQPGAATVLVVADTVLFFNEVEDDRLETSEVSVLDEHFNSSSKRSDTHEFPQTVGPALPHRS